MKYTFKKLEILNITTGRLHTDIGEVYRFFNTVIKDGIMTHNLPNAMRAITPILKTKLDSDYFKDEYTPDVDNTDVVFEFTEDDKTEFWNNFKGLPDPLAKFY